MEYNSHCFTLSEQARSLWAKSGYNEDWLWLPLFVHIYDSWGVANRLWETWLPPGTKGVVVRATGGDSDRARRCVCLLAALHDIGKATPVFQAKDVSSKDASGSYSFVEKLEQVGLKMRNKPEEPHLKKYQSKRRKKRRPTHHSRGGEVIFERYLSEQCGWSSQLARSYACIIGCHHGSFPFSKELSGVSDDIGTYYQFYRQVWKEVQDELITHMVSFAGLDVEDFRYLEKQFMPAVVANVCVGFVIMVDWIASNQDLFPLFRVCTESESDPFYDSDGGVDYQSILGQRLETAWEDLALVPSWQAQFCGEVSENDFYHERFSFLDGAKLRPIQSAVLDVARTTEDPGLIIIEAPMGEGKTEAALAAAEVLAERTGRGGVAVALPTMATTDAMFSRVNRWLKNVPYQPCQGSNAGKSMYLAHGKSQLNEEFQGILGISERTCSAESMDQDADEYSLTERIVVSNWLCGRKKGMLANFVVCTIDQVLMGALMMKHLGLRQLALVNKVVVIDECHAYDVYMQRYLERILEWLGCWCTPVILLSATLPKQQRRAMLEAYCKGRRASFPKLLEESNASSSDTSTFLSYPLLSYTSGQKQLTKGVASSGRAVSVSLEILSDDHDSLVDLLGSLLPEGEGGYVGIICDTVSRAQHVAAWLGQAFGADVVKLVHACFIDFDRMQKEEELRTLLGPDSVCADERCSKKLIVVGTQVLEQSLDIDFDLLITDIAPVDLIMQRLGRLHRHHRGDHNEGRAKKLREAQCFIRGIKKWISANPTFSEGIECVYASASLIESLAVLELRSPNASVSLTLPFDIDHRVQRAYYRIDPKDDSGDKDGSKDKDDSDKQLSLFIQKDPSDPWCAMYQEACEKRIEDEERKRERAEACLLASAARLYENNRTLVSPSLRGLKSAVVGTDDDRWQRAVRDIQETVEVLLLCRYEDRVCLLPWVGDSSHNVEQGSEVPTAVPPAENVARVAAQSSVRLPLKMSRNFDELEKLVNELKEKCSDLMKVWQNSYWLANRLVLVLEQASADCNGREDDKFYAELNEWYVQYSYKDGLTVDCREEKKRKDVSTQ